MRVPKTININGKSQFRIIPSFYPPINFFEEFADNKEDLQSLWQIESITNERLRHETGDIFLVKPEDCVMGLGSSVVMAAFTHIGEASRFTDGTFGIYYAGLTKETAIQETIYHREQFLKRTNEPAIELTMRIYEGKIKKPLHNIKNKSYKKLHDPHDYSASQSFGQKLKELGSWGIIYNSVRHLGGQCIAALRPPAVSIPHENSYLKYIWNGEKITEVLELESVLKYKE